MWRYCNDDDTTALKCTREGNCLIDDRTNRRVCDCLACFGGPYCELNLTTLVPSYEALSYNIPYTIGPYFFLLQVVIILLFLDNVISLQTFLFSKKIRITNIGIYSIYICITRIILAVILQTGITLNLGRVKRSLSYIQFPMATTLFYLGIWSSCCVSVERMFIQLRFFDVALYATRRRALIAIFSLTLFTFITLLIVPVTWLKLRNGAYSDAIIIFIRISIVTHHSLPFFIHLITSLLVLSSLVRHRIRLLQQDELRKNNCSVIFEQLVKHDDFFIQPILYILCSLPLLTIIGLGKEIDDDCMLINDLFKNKLSALPISAAVFLALLILTFPIYIWPSRIYMLEFKNLLTVIIMLKRKVTPMSIEVAVIEEIVQEQGRDDMVTHF